MATPFAAFDGTIHASNVWVNELSGLLDGGKADAHQSYLCLRAVLHALRDRLSVDDAAALAAQLPMLVRGLYYEGWHPHGKPLKERKKEGLLANVRADLPQPDVDVEQIVRAVFSLLARHITGGEIEKLKHTLPDKLRSLWPAESPISVL